MRHHWAVNRPAMLWLAVAVVLAINTLRLFAVNLEVAGEQRFDGGAGFDLIGLGLAALFGVMAIFAARRAWRTARRSPRSG